MFTESTVVNRKLILPQNAKMMTSLQICHSLDRTPAHQASDAAFVLKLKAKYYLGREAVNDIINSVRFICEKQSELYMNQEGRHLPVVM